MHRVQREVRRVWRRLQHAAIGLYEPDAERVRVVRVVEARVYDGGRPASTLSGAHLLPETIDEGVMQEEHRIARRVGQVGHDAAHPVVYRSVVALERDVDEPAEFSHPEHAVDDDDSLIRHQGRRRPGVRRRHRQIAV